MKAGTLDRRITLMRATETQSPSGEPVLTWEVLAGPLWASIAPVSGTERMAAPQVAAQEQVEVRIRWAPAIADLSPRDRIVYPALDVDDPPDEIADLHIYDILAVPEIGRREGFRILATRRADTR